MRSRTSDAMPVPLSRQVNLIQADGLGLVESRGGRAGGQSGRLDADPRAPFDARRTGQFIDEGVAGVQQDVEEDLRYVSAVQVERREAGGELGLQHDATIDGLAE